MRVWFAWSAALSGLIVVFAACGSDSASDASSPTNIDGGVPRDGSSASEGGAPSSDGAAFPQAKGDPCRGVPIPTDSAYVPAGMCARLVASNLPKLRQIFFTKGGDLIGVTAAGLIRRLRDIDGDGFYQPNEIVTLATIADSFGNNADIDYAGGYLYAGSTVGVRRYPYAPNADTLGPPEEFMTGQPTGGHPYHTVHIIDGYAYVNSGSAGNAVNEESPAYDTTRSLVRRFKIADYKTNAPFAWMSGEIFASGLRNMNGFTKNAAGRMYGVVNGLDEVAYAGMNQHNDNPGEQVVRLELGDKFGYPFCYTAQRLKSATGLIEPGTQVANPDFPAHDDAWCAANSKKPATFIQAHSAPLDITFFDSHPQGGLPEKYRGGAFVALHGSWDRGPPTGYKVIWIPFDAQGNAPMPTSDETSTTFPYEIIFGHGDTKGPIDGPWSWTANTFGDEPRPAGVAVSPIDGALYIATDSAGYVYRIGSQK